MILPCKKLRVHGIAPIEITTPKITGSGRLRDRERYCYLASCTGEFSISKAPPCGANKNRVREWIVCNANIIYTDRIMETPQTRYLLRVVMVVTSVAIVPKSPYSYSVYRALVKDCPVSFPLYGGRESEPTDSDNDFGGLDMPSIFTGINLHICQVWPASS